MTDYATLVELLRDRAQTQPQQLAYTFLADGSTESGSLTYGELDRQAKAIAARLQKMGISPGDRALVVYPYTAGLEFIAAFFGCLYAGVVAVADNPPRHDRAIVQLQERATAAEARVLLTTQALLDRLGRVAVEGETQPGLATDTLSAEEGNAWQAPQLDRHTLAYFQYTSGSTGTPKGVMVSHANILYNSEIIRQAFGHSTASQGVIWLPLYHDMGLVGGVIQPLYIGFPVTLMSPVALVRQPMAWLHAISRYRATTSGGPNFAYDLLCRTTPEQRQGLDLSSWEVAFSGAEPVRAETLARFAEAFAPYGFRREAFYPCYGMAEATLFVSGGTKAEAPVVRYADGAALEENRVRFVAADAPGARSIVSCGKAWLDGEIAIVDPETLRRCGSDRVGEIWVSGSGIARGYWQQPEETERTFQATIADTGEGPFLRTGDLGFVWEGELFITGRLKELMILWGRNHYPQHLEHTVEKAHPALRVNCCAAFSIDADGEERLVIASEVERTALRKLAVDEIVSAIRQALVDRHMAEVWVIVLLKTGSLPKTTSGKIQRRACRDRFLAGSLDVVGEWRYHLGESSGISELADRLNGN
ncbi:MAG TPA: fatty acyl-AMP ligase [Oscillatoriales cyanobacterium M4454_W2019_049]|nr:fatty acyl-AMP ligase [Oscillatoriales cyanobacterium M4454_W2019_049]